MDKPSFKLVGSPCGQHGQYTFYKALRVSGPLERVIAIGDFFFVKIWQDSELVSVGELQLLWTDRVSDQTLVSVRLYFLPENTPEGRNLHGEDEVLAINDKVVLKAEDLLSWLCDGASWGCGLRAVWRGACAQPLAAPSTQALHHTKLDFSDVEKEKNLIPQDPESPGVVVFSYPRYCRYRALAARLEGIKETWLKDALVAALGGYAADTKRTAILYCRDTFEYPELESHEYLCNHLAPRLKGRPRGRRRRAARSASRSPDSRSRSRSRSRSSDSQRSGSTRDIRENKTPRRLSLRNGAPERRSEDTRHERERDDDLSSDPNSGEERQFLRRLKMFYKERGESFSVTHALKDVSLLSLYRAVQSVGGHSCVSGSRAWRTLLPHSQHRPVPLRAVYERYLLPFENHERKLGKLQPRINGKIEPIDTITVPDSPQKPEKEDFHITSKPAEELNREFLDSLPKDEKKDVKEKPKISVKPVEKLNNINMKKLFEDNSALISELSVKYNVDSVKVIEEFGKNELSVGSEMFLSEFAVRLNLATPDTAKDLSTTQDLSSSTLSSLSNLTEKYASNGTHAPPNDLKNRPAGRSSLRAVRVKPTRQPLSAGSTPPTSHRVDSASSSPPAPPPAPVTNFGIHHPPTNLTHRGKDSDDEIVEVPYKPKTPEIIDLDEYPESPQSAKKKKLDILKERGLEVTAIPAAPWGGPIAPPGGVLPLISTPPIMLNPAMQHQIMTQASLFQMYNIIPQNYANGIHPPKIIQSSCLYGNTGPEKTVYGNPKDPFMPPPHILHGVPIKQQKIVTTQKEAIVNLRPDILDLTCKTVTPKPAVEIVRIPSVPSPTKAQNLAKNYSLLDGKAMVGSNLEITLVSPKSPSPKNRTQKRSSNGKFASAKTPTTPTPPKDYAKFSPSPSGVKNTNASPTVKKPPINIPNYQIRDDSPTSSTSSRESSTRNSNLPPSLNLPPGLSNLPQMAELQHLQSLQNLQKQQNINQLIDAQKNMPMTPFVDPLYMLPLYSSLANMDQRQLAMYRDFMATQFRGYSGLLGGVPGVTPTTKN